MNQFLGQLPVEISSTPDRVKVNATRKSLIYSCLLLIISTAYVCFAHFTMNYDHLKHKNPVIVNVAFFQIVSISLTAVIGAFNILIMRKDLVKVTNQSADGSLISKFIYFLSYCGSLTASPRT